MLFCIFKAQINLKHSLFLVASLVDFLEGLFVSQVIKPGLSVELKNCGKLLFRPDSSLITACFVGWEGFFPFGLVFFCCCVFPQQCCIKNFTSEKNKEGRKEGN